MKIICKSLQIRTDTIPSIFLLCSNFGIHCRDSMLDAGGRDNMKVISRGMSKRECVCVCESKRRAYFIWPVRFVAQLKWLCCPQIQIVYPLVSNQAFYCAFRNVDSPQKNSLEMKVPKTSWKLQLNKIYSAFFPFLFTSKYQKV